MKERHIAGLGQWRDDARLQNSVSAHHPQALCVPLRQVVGVGCHLHQGTQAPRRELGITIKRHHVAGMGRNARLFAQAQKAVATTFCQIVDKQLQLAALALPANPLLFGLAVAALPVQQNKARKLGSRDFCIECCNLPPRMHQQCSIGIAMQIIGIGPVTEQRKLSMALGVSQRMQVQLVHQLVGGCLVGQHARNYHHYTMLRRYTFR